MRADVLEVKSQMKLYILRHGDAGQNGDPAYPNDDLRPLSQKGMQRTRSLAHALRGMEIEFDEIISSPLKRARQTAEIIERGVLFKGRLELSAHLSPTGDMEKLMTQLAGIHPEPDSVLIVGHEPYLSALISLLCIGGGGLPVTMRKGGLCRLEVESPRAGKCATLEWLLTPRMFESKRPKRKSTR